MLERLCYVVRQEVSGEIAFDYVAGISRFHRIQASPGFREAALWCKARLDEAGLEGCVLSYPARYGQRFWSEALFPEWSCREAVLDLVEPAAQPRRLCDFRVNPQSVIQRSTATPPDGLEAPLTVVDRADDPDSYCGRDVSGKFVLFTGEAQQVLELAVGRLGAVGLVTDQMPEFPPVRGPFDLAGATTYTSFWPLRPLRTPAIGFVVSPAEGARLRRLLREGATVRLRARIDARLADGHVENVTAVIPGRDGPTADEVLLVAHLCHPKPSANDNASGSGALLETARALAALIASGRLARPRRGIRFLLVPEMTGTFAYLATDEEARRRTVAALNLDMVGENQALTGSPLQVEYPPLACPDFGGDLLLTVVQRLSAEVKNLRGTASLPLFVYGRAPFSGGSDHYILSDPSVGIPCPMLIQFPDRFYHTSADTLDKVDPAMLGRVAAMAAVYLYFAACAGPREALWLGEMMVGRFARDLSRLGDEFLSRLAGGERDTHAPRSGPGFSERLLERKAGLLAESKVQGLRLLARRLGGSESPAWLPRLERRVREAVAGEVDRVRRAAAELVRQAPALTEGAAGRRPSAPGTQPAQAPEGGLTGDPHDPRLQAVPVRVRPGPVSLRSLLASLPLETEEKWRAWTRVNDKSLEAGPQLLYWMDGRRSLAEVLDCLELETGFRDEAFALEYVDLLVEAGIVAMGPRRPGPSPAPQSPQSAAR